MDRRRPSAWIAVTAALVVGCFPDDQLHTDAGASDATSDLGQLDATSDLGPMDAHVDAGLPGDLGARDAGFDAGSDVGFDSGPVMTGPSCDMAPASAASRLVLDTLSGANDFAFDGRGGVAVAQGANVIMRRAGATTPVTMAMSGVVVALRYTRHSGLVLATFNDTGSGTGSGAIYRLADGDTTPTVLQSGLRQPGGLAVDANDGIWFSDTPMNTVYRIAADGGDAGAGVVVTDVMSPTHLLIDYQGRYLFVAQSFSNTVMKLDLNPDAGTVGAAMNFVGGFSRVSGLAQDECGNVFVADEIVDRIWRVPISAGASVRVVTDVHGPRSLMFGVGDPFGPRELYSLSATDGTLRAANLIARGVPLPVPAP